MPIVQVTFEGEKSSIRHLDNYVKDGLKEQIILLGEIEKAEKGTSLTVFYYSRLENAADVKRELNSWLNNNFRPGTPNSPRPDVEVKLYNGTISEILEGISTEVDTALETRLAEQTGEISRLQGQLEASKKELAEKNSQNEWAMKEVERLQDFSQKQIEYEAAQKSLISENESLKTELEYSENAIKGLSNNYNRKTQTLKDLQKRLEESKAAMTPEDIRIGAVRQCANEINVVEQELKHSGLLEDLNDLLSLPISLTECANREFGKVFESDEVVINACKYPEQGIAEGDKQTYANSIKTVKFYDTIRSSGVEVPDELKPMILQIEQSYGNHKTIISNFEALQEKIMKGMQQAVDISKLVEKHRESVEARRILAKVSKVDIYLQFGDRKYSAYIPAGTKDGFFHNMISSNMQELSNLNIDEFGVVKLSGDIVQEEATTTFFSGAKVLFGKYFSKTLIYKESVF